MQISKKHLQAALGLLSKIVKQSTVLPITGCVYISKTLIKGTNLQTTIEVDIAGITTLGEEFEPICIDYRKLVEAVAAIPETAINLVSNGTTLNLTAPKANIRIHGEKAADFPQKTHEAGQLVVMRFGEFLEVASKTVNFTLDAVIASSIAGVNFNGEEFAATNQHTLCHRKISTPVAQTAIIFPAEVIDAACQIAGDLNAEAEIRIDGNMVATPFCRIYFQAIEGRFPAYQNFLPPIATMGNVRIGKDDLMAAIKLAKVTASATSRMAGLTMLPTPGEGDLVIEAKDFDFMNEGKAEAAAVFTPPAGQVGPLVIGLNLLQLETCLDAIPDAQVVVYYNNDYSKPIYLSSDNMAGGVVLMPVFLPGAAV